MNARELRDWLLDEKNIFINVYYSIYHKLWLIDEYFADVDKNKLIPTKCGNKKYATYNEALDVATKYAKENLIK